MIPSNCFRESPILLLFSLCLMAYSAVAQEGATFLLRDVQDQLVQIGNEVGRLETTANEMVLAERSRCDRPVSWNRKLPDSERFALALNGSAYCDLETGLVWAESPLQDTYPWTIAKDRCRLLEIDGRYGWHLPSIEQLLTLVDRQNSFPALPSGHPFSGELNNVYLTSSPVEQSVYGQFRQVWFVDMGTGQALSREVRDPPFPETGGTWCVRGGANPLPIADINLFGTEVGSGPD